MGVNDFPIALLIVTVMIALPMLILCQFRKMEKKGKTVLSLPHVPAAQNSDSVRKLSANDATQSMEKKLVERQKQAINEIGAPQVVEKVKYAEGMQNGTLLRMKMNPSTELIPDISFKSQKCKSREGKNYQIIGDLDTSHSSLEYSLDNTLAVESLEKIKGKYGVILEGEEVDHQMIKAPQQSDSSDYSLLDSQSSRRDIREQRFRLFRLNTSVARRVATALQDSELSTSTQDKKEKPTAATDKQIFEVEETQNNLVAHT
ncbi:unnamed protein product [Litomosoides sigmodontis]|uniref:Uncharacterized protein n=1 Tax=Litomosoides sigmodontis TaxID=42156 RepID=A0A3P6SLY6_LITSI|nr:unnamed protein product [Litomosoides sigmodontis]